MRALTCFVAVRAGERFLWRRLRTNGKSEQENAEGKGKQESPLLTAQTKHLAPPKMIDLAFR